MNPRRGEIWLADLNPTLGAEIAICSENWRSAIANYEHDCYSNHGSY